MIETFKIATEIYDTVVSPVMLRRDHHMQQEVTASDNRILGQDIIYVNTISLTVLPICRVFCLVMSFLQNL